MSGGEVLLGILVGLLVNEFCDLSPWVARKLVRWSARHRYTNPARVEIRAEELAGLIDQRPGKLFKLATALSFVSAAIVAIVCRTIARSIPRKIKKRRSVEYDDRQLLTAKLNHLQGVEARVRQIQQENVNSIITTLMPTRDAVIRIGGLLIVKMDGVVTVRELTCDQQNLLDHQPHLAQSPGGILAALDGTDG